MEPKTKLQKQVAVLGAKLPELTENQIQWAKRNAVEHIGFRTKKAILCTDCGEKYPDTIKVEDGKIDICPNCGCHLKIESSRKQKDRKIDYFSIITTMKGFQVVRHFYISKHSKAGQKAYYFIDEVVQRWLFPNGKYVTKAKTKKPFAYYCYDVWNHGSNLEFRSRDNLDYYICGEAIYPVRRYIPVLKRNGFKGDFHDISAFKLFCMLLTQPHAETLLKAGQYDALYYLARGYNDAIDSLWPAIKICIRQSYIIKDFSIWKDYCSLLEYFKKDMRNARYVCPDNLSEVHDRLVKRKREIDRKERERQKRIWEVQRKQREIEKKIREENAKIQYVKDKSKYFDLVFEDNLLKIKALQSVQEFMDESNEMHHCVYTNEYYNRKESLIFSARIGDERIATIEISLNNYSIIQCRGKYNQPTPYDEQIIKLINQNMRFIKRKKTA